MNVALYGATAKPDRYAYMAFSLLREKGHTVFPIHPRLEVVDGVAVYKTLAAIDAPIHTLTLYIGPSKQEEVAEDILQASLSRVIFNPGTENPDLQKALEERGVTVVEGCSLVMLKTGMWDS